MSDKNRARDLTIPRDSTHRKRREGAVVWLRRKRRSPTRAGKARGTMDIESEKHPLPHNEELEQRIASNIASDLDPATKQRIFIQELKARGALFADKAAQARYDALKAQNP